MLKLELLLLREGGHYVAQCLEHDIAAQGKSIPEVKKAFEDTLAGFIAIDSDNGCSPLSKVPPAPAMYQTPRKLKNLMAQFELRLEPWPPRTVKVRKSPTPFSAELVLK